MFSDDKVVARQNVDYLTAHLRLSPSALAQKIVKIKQFIRNFICLKNTEIILPHTHTHTNHAVQDLIFQICSNQIYHLKKISIYTRGV